MTLRFSTAIVPSRIQKRKTVLAAVLLLCCGAAQAQSMEERLRAQLRATTAELEQARSQLAQQAAAPAATAPEADAAETAALRAQLAAAQGQLDSLSANNRALLQQAQDIANQANAQIAQTKVAYDALARTAQAKETERAQAQQQATQLKTQNEACMAKNAQLYAISREILDAYEGLGGGGLFAARQPFAGKSRVRLENAAQAYGDRIYGQRCDVQVAAAPQPQTAPAAATSPEQPVQTPAAEAPAAPAPPPQTPAAEPAPEKTP